MPKSEIKKLPNPECRPEGLSLSIKTKPFSHMCTATSQDISAPIQLFVPVLISQYSTSTERLNDPWQMWSLISECKLKQNISGRHGANAQLPVFPSPSVNSDITQTLRSHYKCFVRVSWLQRAHAKQGDHDTKKHFLHSAPLYQTHFKISAPFSAIQAGLKLLNRPSSCFYFRFS